jgi:hypothetical protein
MDGTGAEYMSELCRANKNPAAPNAWNPPGSICSLLRRVDVIGLPIDPRAYSGCLS